MTDSAHILVIDDDQRLRSLLSRYLTENGFVVSAAASGAEARAILRSVQPDALVLDVMMPGETGLDLAEDLRRRPDPPPVLMLTARGAPEDRIAGFEAGADDYLAKPFEPYELVLRLRAMLRRTVSPEPAAPVSRLPLGGAWFDLARRELRGRDGPIYLTESEASLLFVLASHPNTTLARYQIATVLELGNASERAVDVQVTRLRRKLEADPREPRFLHTVRGQGYMLKPGT